MKSSIMLCGEKVVLKSCTKELWHEYYKNYVADPMMDPTPYSYDAERTEKAFYIKTSDDTRLYFIIFHNGMLIGQIYLKHMDQEKKATEFGIALINDSVKGKGFGTEAIMLLTDYAFHVLGFKSILADSVLQNTRSQYVLEKTGFLYTHEDSVFKYYKLEKNDSYSFSRREDFRK